MEPEQLESESAGQITRRKERQSQRDKPRRYNIDQIFSPAEIRAAVISNLLPSRQCGRKMAIDTHPRIVCTQIREVEILALRLNGYTLREIAEQVGMSPRGAQLALDRVLARAGCTSLNEVVDLEIKPELVKAFDHAAKLREACAAWLADPDRPERYTLAPRATEVEVVYDDPNDVTREGRPRRKKMLLQDMLEKVARQMGVSVVDYDRKGADPRKLILESLDRHTAILHQYAQLVGAYKQPDKNPEEVKREEERAAMQQRQAEQERAWAQQKWDEVRSDLQAQSGRTLEDAEVWNWLDEHVPAMAEMLTPHLRGAVTQSAAVN